VNIEWHITQDDRDCIRAIVCEQRETVLMRDRRKRNLAGHKDRVTKQRLWRAIVCMRLTTLAHSGPTGNLAIFWQHRPFPLSYDDAICAQKSLEDFILKELRAHRVGRHPPTIAKQLAANFRHLEKDDWRSILHQCNRLTSLESRAVEAKVADYLATNLEGFGPKQSRNVLQALGLTRYEIPIDSRVTAWLNEKLKFPFRVSAASLADKYVYQLISDAICQLCKDSGEFPCILDAAIFGSKDGDTWTEELLLY
jgi:hypothetical protein